MSFLYMEDWLIELEGGVGTMSAEEVEMVWQFNAVLNKWRLCSYIVIIG